MKQFIEFRIGCDEHIFGKNDTLEEVFTFLRNAGVGKEMRITVTIKDKDDKKGTD